MAALHDAVEAVHLLLEKIQAARDQANATWDATKDALDSARTFFDDGPLLASCLEAHEGIEEIGLRLLRLDDSTREAANRLFRLTGERVGGAALVGDLAQPLAMAPPAPKEAPQPAAPRPDSPAPPSASAEGDARNKEEARQHKIRLRRTAAGAGLTLAAYGHDILSQFNTIVPGWGWGVLAGIIGGPAVWKHFSGVFKEWRGKRGH